MTRFHSIYLQGLTIPSHPTKPTPISQTSQAEAFNGLLEQNKEKALADQREKLATESRATIEELEAKLKEAEEAAAMYAKLSETVTQSVEALKQEAEQNAKQLANYFRTVAKDTIERERAERMAVIKDMAVRLELLEKHRADNVDSARKIADLQKLHGAVNALGIALREHAGKPFKSELDMLAKVGEENPVVKNCVTMVSDAANEGIISDFELERWFIQGVKGAASKAGRMEGDGGVLSYVTSNITSLFPVGKKSETDTIIEQAERYLREGDIEAAAREVNQLQGWAKVAAKDWLEAARRKVKANYAYDVSSTSFVFLIAWLFQRRRI